MNKFFKNLFLYLAAPALSLIIFALIFQIWKLDLTKPVFGYEGDDLLTLFIAKNIIETGWIFSNDSLSFPFKFIMHDFPIHADSLNLALLKLFSLFSSNPFLIVNWFFITTFALIALTAFTALRNFGISFFTALLVSNLYVFLPYHFMRGISHLFLSNYAIVPLVIMAALWLLNDEVKLISLNKKKCLIVSPNTKFFLTLAIALITCASGIYYAFFTIIIFIAACFFCSIKKNKSFIFSSLTTLAIIQSMIITLIYLNLPSIIYWAKEGPGGFGRSPSESELYALKIIYLFLPVANHYFDYLANLRHLFDSYATESESAAESLGILGSTSFMFLILWTICRNYNEKDSVFFKTISRFSLSKKERDFISNLSAINIFLVLFFTVSGFVMFFSISFPQIRSHARISIFIAFLALSAMALIGDKILQKDFSLVKKNTIRFLFSAIFILAIFDQVGKITLFVPDSNDRVIASYKTSEKFISDQHFVEEIEKSIPKKAIFIFPIQSFSESGSYEFLTMYLHSKTLLWSAPSFEGRDSYKWQKTFFTEGFDKFFTKIKNNGFSGVVINRREYLEKKDFLTITSKLKSQALDSPITSPDGNWTFYKIN